MNTHTAIGLSLILYARAPVYTLKTPPYMYSRGQKKVNIPFPLHEDDATTKRKRNETKTLERIHDTARNQNGN